MSLRDWLCRHDHLKAEFGWMRRLGYHLPHRYPRRQAARAS